MRRFTWKYNDEISLDEIFNDDLYSEKASNISTINNTSKHPQDQPNNSFDKMEYDNSYSENTSDISTSNNDTSHFIPEEQPTSNDLINKTDNFSEIDVLLDIHLWNVIRKHLKSNENIISEHTQNLCRFNTLIHNFVDYSKHLLRCINMMAKSSSNPKSHLKEIAYAFISEYRSNWPMRRYIDFNHYRNSFSELFENDDTKKILEQLEKITEKSSKFPYYWLEKLAQYVDEEVLAKRMLIKSVQFANPYSPLSSHLLTCQLALSDEAFNVYISQSAEQVASYLENSVNTYFEIAESTNTSFLQQVEQIRKILNSTDSRNENIFGKYKDDGRGCSGLIDFENYQLFSFSGPFDAYESDVLRYLSFSPKRQASNAALNNKIQTHCTPIMIGFNWAKFNKKIERFYNTKTQMPNPFPDTVESAISNLEMPSDIGNDFSCCERKMFSFIPKPVSGQGFLFTTRKPCHKCVPAIKAFINPHTHLRIYYLDKATGDVIELNPNTL